MILQKVKAAISEFDMLRSTDKVLVGVSGGPDSVALLHLLVEMAPELELGLVVAHLNHGLRAEAVEDTSLCEELARKLGLTFVSGRVDVAREAKDTHRCLEDAGRRARYRFLEESAQALACDRIAVGHTRDDQAETFLHRLLRGSGSRGLASVHPVVDSRRIRPLFRVRRAEILDYLSQRGIPFRNDSSNDDERFTRNRLRHRTLPLLSKEYNPRLVETLSATADLLRDDEAWMEEMTERAFTEIARSEGDAFGLAVPELERLHHALKRRLVRLAIARVRGDLTNVSKTHVEATIDLLSPGKSGREVHLPGLAVERSFDRLWIRAETSGKERERAKPGYNGFEYELSFPARVRVPELEGVLATSIDSSPATRVPGGEPAAVGRAVVIGIEGRLPVIKVRSSSPGDRFRPLGAPGSRTLRRYLMERKVPRSERARVPVVVRNGGDSSEEILWVVGHAISESARMTDGRTRLELRWVSE
jgi:tRNA(Ile)-lysidine synthase